MKGKKKDDNGKPKSASESMRTNQLADLLAHVEAGMVDRLFWISVEASEESGVLNGVFTVLQNSYVLHLLSERIWWFL